MYDYADYIREKIEECLGIDGLGPEKYQMEFNENTFHAWTYRILLSDEEDLEIPTEKAKRRAFNLLFFLVTNDVPKRGIPYSWRIKPYYDKDNNSVRCRIFLLPFDKDQSGDWCDRV